jgi:hypothetical protein
LKEGFIYFLNHFQCLLINGIFLVKTQLKKKILSLFPHWFSFFNQILVEAEIKRECRDPPTGGNSATVPAAVISE